MGHVPPSPVAHIAEDLGTHPSHALTHAGWVITDQYAGVTEFPFSDDELAVLGAPPNIVLNDGVGDGAQQAEPESPWRSWLRSTVLGDMLYSQQSTPACAPWRLRFDDIATEERAARELFSHTLRGTAAVMGVWCAILLGALMLASAFPGLVESRMPVTAIIFAPIIATAVVSCAAFFALHRCLPSLSGEVQRRLRWALLAGCLGGMVAVAWFCLGPGTRMRVGKASAAGAGVSNDSGASPFEGQILMTVVSVTFMQAVCHMRLPVAHTAIIAVACCALTIGFAVVGIFNSARGWPSDAVGLGVWAIASGVGANALLATGASFSWEARCRAQHLMAAAARAAETEATALLENLLPPVVVAEYKAGRVMKPALARDVVIVWGDIVGFTALASRLEPLQLMAHLNTIYRSVAKHGCRR